MGKRNKWRCFSSSVLSIDTTKFLFNVVEDKRKCDEEKTKRLITVTMEIPIRKIVRLSSFDNNCSSGGCAWLTFNEFRCIFLVRSRNSKSWNFLKVISVWNASNEIPTLTTESEWIRQENYTMRRRNRRNSSKEFTMSSNEFRVNCICMSNIDRWRQLENISWVDSTAAHISEATNKRALVQQDLSSSTFFDMIFSSVTESNVTKHNIFTN